MIEREILIKNETGLHARPAGRFVNKSKNYISEIKLVKGNKEINAKSIMSVMTLGASKGKKLKIQASGKDEEKAVNELSHFIEVELPLLENKE